jgi:cytidine deaminase
MKKITVGTEIFESENISDFSPDDQRLIAAATEAADSSWAPYSKFSVGAAVRLSDGTIVKGCNVENAAFPSGICAEHNALSTSASLYPGLKPVAIAISALKNGRQVSAPVAPCGNCRQVIAEEESRHNTSIRVIMTSKGIIRMVERGSDLLPLLFSQKDISPDSQ